MPTCNKCGEPIEFRYVDGRCIPIHPDGGWHCGSWRGGASSSQVGASASRKEPRQWREKEFTRPTTCPECGASVFFIRHNGGSVWVDELGWPWPKQGCFDEYARSSTSLNIWSAKAAGLQNPKLGIVTHLRHDGLRTEPTVTIRLTDSTRLSLVLRWTPPESAI